MTPGMVRSPAMHDGFRPEEWAAPQRHTPEEKVSLIHYVETKHNTIITSINYK